MPEIKESERRDSFRIEMSAYISHKPKLAELALATDYFRDLESLTLNCELNNLKLEFEKLEYLFFIL